MAEQSNSQHWPRPTHTYVKKAVRTTGGGGSECCEHNFALFFSPKVRPKTTLAKNSEPTTSLLYTSHPSAALQRQGNLKTLHTVNAAD